MNWRRWLIPGRTDRFILAFGSLLLVATLCRERLTFVYLTLFPFRSFDDSVVWAVYVGALAAIGGTFGCWSWPALRRGWIWGAVAIGSWCLIYCGSHWPDLGPGDILGRQMGHLLYPNGVIRLARSALIFFILVFLAARCLAWGDGYLNRRWDDATRCRQAKMIAIAVFLMLAHVVTQQIQFTRQWWMVSVVRAPDLIAWFFLIALAGALPAWAINRWRSVWVGLVGMVGFLLVAAVQLLWVALPRPPNVPLEYIYLVSFAVTALLVRSGEVADSRDALPETPVPTAWPSVWGVAVASVLAGGIWFVNRYDPTTVSYFPSWAGLDAARVANALNDVPGVKLQVSVSRRPVGQTIQYDISFNKYVADDILSRVVWPDSSSNVVVIDLEQLNPTLDVSRLPAFSRGSVRLHGGVVTADQIAQILERYRSVTIHFPISIRESKGTRPLKSFKQIWFWGSNINGSIATLGPILESASPGGRVDIYCDQLSFDDWRAICALSEKHRVNVVGPTIDLPTAIEIGKTTTDRLTVDCSSRSELRAITDPETLAVLTCPSLGPGAANIKIAIGSDEHRVRELMKQLGANEQQESVVDRTKVPDPRAEDWCRRGIGSGIQYWDLLFLNRTPIAWHFGRGQYIRQYGLEASRKPAKLTPAGVRRCLVASHMVYNRQNPGEPENVEKLFLDVLRADTMLATIPIPELKELSLDYRWLDGLDVHYRIHESRCTLSGAFLYQVPNLESLILPPTCQIDLFDSLQILPRLKHFQGDGDWGSNSEMVTNDHGLETLTLFSVPPKIALQQIARLPRLRRLVLVDQKGRYADEPSRQELMSLFPESVEVRILSADQLPLDIPKDFQQHVERVRAELIQTYSRLANQTQQTEK